MKHLQIAISLLLPWVAMYLRWILGQQIAPYTWVVLFPAVLTSTYLGGYRVGIINTFVCAFGAIYFFIPPEFSFSVKPSSYFSIFIFIIFSLTSTYIFYKWERRLKFYLQIIESMTDAVYLIKKDTGKIVYTNSVLDRIFGYKKKEVIGKYESLLKPKEISQELEAKKEELQKQFGLNSKIELSLKKDGSLFWTKSRTTNFRHVDFEEVSLVILEDISKEVISISENTILEKRSQAMLEAIPDLVFRLNSQGVFLDYKADEKELFHQANSIIGKSFQDTMPQNIVTLVDKVMKKVFSTQSLETFEYELDIPKLGVQQYEARIIPVALDEVIVIVRNVTDKHKIAKTLSESEKKYRLLAENSTDVIWVLNLTENRFTYISPSIFSLRGLTPEEAMNESLEDSLSPESVKKVKDSVSKRLPIFLAYPNDPIISYDELQQYKKNGELIWIETATRYQFNENKEVEVLGITRNIEKRKQIENELREAKKIAEKSNRLKSEFLANMSHEIRTPLNGILGLVYLLQDTQMSKEQKDYLSRITNASSLLIEILNNILDFSKIEAGYQTLEEGEFKLEEVISYMNGIFSPKAKSKGIHFFISVENGVPNFLYGDKLHINQILQNLVSNSLKFTEKGEIQVQFSVKEFMENDFVLSVIVRDTGIGIPESFLPTLFNSFAQADESNARKYGGTGLGLAICKKLVHLMGGEIEVQSVVGEGTTFRFTVRLKKIKSISPENKISNSDNATELSESSNEIELLKKTRILLAEDNDLNQLIAKKVFQKLGLNLEIAENGLKAVELISKNNYDAVLMDVQMPIMDGIEATKRIRLDKKNQNLPIIAVSAAAMAEDREKSISAGMNDHIAKPFEPVILINTLQKWIFGNKS
ncbi:MAG: PAS domain S-box protein [Leptospiraceae bacterium]|nr:PAS domain S-box protein [Leptospiraceae bacterium]NUM40684.1 PAS domain S-box protein [Leptospiraceae bacterium]